MAVYHYFRHETGIITIVSFRCYGVIPYSDVGLRQSRDLHSRIPTRSGILLSDMNGQIFYTIHYLNHPRSDGIC